MRPTIAQAEGKPAGVRDVLTTRFARHVMGDIARGRRR